jgi:putative MATE family efflux protein
MGFPTIVGFAAHNVYLISDMFWLSRLGPEPVAALAIFWTFFWIVDAVNQFAGAGSVSVISRRFGEADLPRTETAIAEAFLLKFLLGIGFAVVSIPAMSWIAHTLGARDEVLALTVEYGQVMLLALPFSFPTWTVFTALRCIGYPRTAMTFMMASALLNVVLDPFLIFGWAGLPRLGITGAAWSCLISFAITVGLGLVLFFSGAFPLRLTLAGIGRARFATMLQMLQIGIPLALASVSFSLGRLVMMPLIATFGAPAIAVYGAGNRVLQVVEVVAEGIQMGIAALIGHALGRKQPHLAWRTATHGVALGVLLMTALAVLGAVYARPLIRIFFDEPEYVELGVVFFRIHAVAFPFMGAFILFDGVFSGAGNTVPPMVIGAIHCWLMQIPAIWLLAYPAGMGPTGAFWGLAIGSIVGSCLYTWWFFRKRWLHTVV